MLTVHIVPRSAVYVLPRVLDLVLPLPWRCDYYAVFSHCGNDKRGKTFNLNLNIFCRRRVAWLRGAQ